MKLKINAQGLAEVKDGLPVYVYDDGKEIPFDAVAAVAKIKALNGEAQGHREAKEAAEAKLVSYAKIPDAEAAPKALDTVKNLDDKKLVDAGKVEEVRAAAVREYEARLRAAETAHAQALQAANDKAAKHEKSLVDEMIGGAFQRSAYIKDKVAIPADLLQSKFGPQFQVVDGKMIATDGAGNRIYSRKRPGEDVVDFDEAIEIVIDSYPQKASILKGANANGGGTQNNGGGGSGGQKTIKRADWQRLPIEQQGPALKDAVLVD